MRRCVSVGLPSAANAMEKAPGAQKEMSGKRGGTRAGWNGQHRQDPVVRAPETRDPQVAWLGRAPSPGPDWPSPAAPMRCPGLSGVSVVVEGPQPALVHAISGPAMSPEPCPPLSAPGLYPDHLLGFYRQLVTWWASSLQAWSMPALSFLISSGIPFPKEWN